MSSADKNKPNGIPEWGEDLMKRLDAFLYEKPTRNIMESIDSFFDQAKGYRKIPVDVKETETEWIVLVELPGIKRDQVQIKLLGNQIQLTVSHDEETEKYDQNTHYYHKERRKQNNQRLITLPYPVDRKTAKARFYNGVLEIRGPKGKIDQNTLHIE
ncbi:Hsp20/alpha crystallin family protein [Gracilibacillus sp. YIM 98692]|uniref:Hsp20/alpha crystallin family protein n=1 Tax=Gracilibacillus sp. YIM 98692 TaxID=2663532 RepID=UPI0013D69DCA|nr:Hsp20/alpha crystallin family protein [Gracilibacillus sp. YIM 98692]